MRKELKFTELNTLSDKDCTAAFGKINGSPIVIASVYFDILNPDVVPVALNNLMTYVDTNDFSLLLGIDTNDHSPLYGNNSSPRGVILEEFIF